MKRISLITLTIFAVLQVSAQSGLKQGVQAPNFTGTDNFGHKLDLKALLKTHKAVLLFFYRGQWCPYCNKHIADLQDSLQMLSDKNVYVVGVTPETSDNIARTVGKTHASFSIIQDKGYKIMKAYDVNYHVGDELFAKLKSYGVGLDRNNGNTDRVLPVPATYLIDRSRKIIYVQFNNDYTKRAPVSAVLAALGN